MLLPSDVRPAIPWQTSAPLPSAGLVALQANSERERATDALIACIYTGDAKGVEASLAERADPVAVSSMWGTSPLHAACSYALSQRALQPGLLISHLSRQLAHNQSVWLPCRKCLVAF